MALTPTQHRDIMNAYDQLRRDNELLHQRRTEEINRIIPEIKEIDDALSSASISSAKKQLFQTDEHEKQAIREALHAQITSSIQKKKELLLRHGYPEDYLDPIYQCSYCKDTGYIQDQKCSCFQKKIRQLMYQQSNLMGSVNEQNFDTFQILYYSDQPGPDGSLSPRDNMREVLESCFSFIRNVQAGLSENLLIHGNPGVGKTFLTTCIAREVMNAGKSVIYLTSYQLFEQLANHTFRKDKNQKQTSDFTAAQILEADLLIIDDLGTEMNNTFINSQLFLCINERILNKKSTIINTNFSLNQISKTYTERISSRLIQFYTILHIFGEDIRIKKAVSPIDEYPIKML